MGQDWDIQCLSCGRRITGDCDDLRYMVYSQRSQYMAIPYLLPPPLPSSPLSIKAHQDREALGHSHVLSPPQTRPDVVRRFSGSTVSFKREEPQLNDLPPEVVGMVFSHIPEFIDAFCLGLTCTFVWSSGERHIQKLWTANQAPCIGHRLICRGSSMGTPPPGCMSEEARDEIAKTYGHPTFSEYQSISDDERDDLWNGSNPRRSPRQSNGSEEDALSQFAESLAFHVCRGVSNYPPKLDVNDWMVVCWRLARTMKTAAGAFDYELAKLWIKGPHPRASFENENILVLRNLSSKLFVRSDILTTVMSDGARLLGQGLLYYISWSDSVPSRFENREPMLSEGPWAGDRFDIVTLESLGGDGTRLTNEGWKDASQEVRDRIDIVEGWDVLEEGRAPYEYED